jgi:hypothetical protein
VLVVSPQLAFARGADAHARYLRAIDAMMTELGPQNARASAAMRAEYSEHLDYLVLAGYPALEAALYTGGLVPLPWNYEQLNVRVRTDGPAPIAEMDLANQTSYIAARSSTVGALLDVARRVESGPIEITSLVRHSDYQDALRETNVNANTSVPMHTMGLAFDIALVNTPLQTVYEIRDVLNQMQRDGDILFVGERRQLVFHVVPHPSRLGYYADVYAAALTGSWPAARELPSTAVHKLAPLPEPVVRTEVAAIRPTDEHAAEWWAAEGAPSDLMIAVTPIASTQIGAERRSFFGRIAARIAAVFSGVVHSARQFLH